MSNHREKKGLRKDGDRIEIVDPNLKRGFAQVPRPVLRAVGVSDKGKLLYALLLDYAWSSDSCFPGQARLASDLHTTARTIQRVLQELRNYGLISWKRRGVMKTNIYYILPLSDCPHLDLTDTPKTAPRSDATSVSHQEATFVSYQDTTPVSHKEYSVEHTQKEQYSDLEHSNSRKGPRAGKAPPAASATDGESRREIPEAVGDIMARTGKSGRGRGSPRPETLDEDYQRIQDYIADRAREFNDTASLKSSTTRAYRLYKASGISIEAFVERIFQARALTQERTAAITKTAEDPEYHVRRKTKMAYFFAVLEDQLGLAEPRPESSGKTEADGTPDGPTDPYGRFVQH